jgi:iron(III) transport system substrate-binding protein
MNKAGILSVILLPLLGLASGCSKSEPTVVVYTSVDEVFSRPIAERFEKEHNIKVTLLPDTEETKSTGLVNRLIAEKDRPQADVFWSGDPVRTAILKSKGVTTAYRSPQAKDLPAKFSDPEGHWTGFSARARIIMYNTNLVKAGEEPQSVLDLLDARFQGKACMADPLFGSTSMHAAALFDKLGDKEAKSFFEGFAKNGGKNSTFLPGRCPEEMAPDGAAVNYGLSHKFSMSLWRNPCAIPLANITRSSCKAATIA